MVQEAAAGFRVYATVHPFVLVSMSLSELVKKKKEEQYRVEQDEDKIAEEGPPHHHAGLGPRREGNYPREAHQDVYEDSQVVPQSTRLLAC